jgi:hypothetical protein
MILSRFYCHKGWLQPPDRVCARFLSPVSEIESRNQVATLNVGTLYGDIRPHHVTGTEI